MAPLPLLDVLPDRPDAELVARAGAVLRAGGLVVYPTETYYAVGADARSEAACRRVFTLKGRREDRPLPCIAADVSQVERFTTSFPPLARRLAREFWPGPLSLVLDAREELAARGADGTTAIRVSGLSLARALAAELGAPVVSTSANPAGRPPSVSAREAASMEGTLDLVLDGGKCPGGAPSTLIDVRSDAPRLVREGAISWERILHAVSGSGSP